MGNRKKEISLSEEKKHTVVSVLMWLEACTGRVLYVNTPITIYLIHVLKTIKQLNHSTIKQLNH